MAYAHAKVRPSSHSAVRQFFFPNGLLVVAGLSSLAIAPALDHALITPMQWACGAMLVASALLAVRLRSLRVFLGTLSLGAYLAVLALVKIELGFIGFLTVLVAVDFALLLLVEDSFFDWQAVMWWLGLLFVEWTVFISAVRWSPAMFATIGANRISLPFVSFGVIELVFASAAVALFGRFLYAPDSTGAGLLWGLVALAPGLHGSMLMMACIALSGMVLAVAAVERSHWIAYHDELTGLPGRRAFNEALAALGDCYSIAIVDVDHFKKFNDTFGHDTGDHVLRKVAAQLSRVSGGGVAFRCGGEEFAIVFAGSGMNEAWEHTEGVRASIVGDGFIARGPSRSQRERPDRRSGSRRKQQPRAVETSVTVSIGLAEGAPQFTPENVVEAADNALYRAKHLGRNRVEKSVSAVRPKRRKLEVAEEPAVRS